MNEEVDVYSPSSPAIRGAPPGAVDVTGSRGTEQAVVRRYTNPAPTPAPPVPTPPVLTGEVLPPAATPTKPALEVVDENAVREETRKRMQTQIDAISAEFANLIAREQVAGEDRAGQTRAINARSGLVGSDFGTAQANKTQQFNQSQVKALQDEQNARIQSVLTNIEDRASAEIKAKKEEALGKYQREQGDFLATQEQARADLKILAESGADISKLNPAQKTALLKQAGYDDPAFGELIFNAMRPKASQIDYKFEKLADGAGLFYGTDPVTGELKTQRVTTPIPDGFTLTIAPDGTPILFNKTTGQARIAEGFQQGDLAKPEDELDTVKKKLEIEKLIRSINGSEELTENPRKQAAFNHIVDKYNANQVIQAADKTSVLMSNIAQLKKDPASGANQLPVIYSYIKALDLYDSAVREGEINLAQQTQSLIGNLENQVNRISNGQIVTPQTALDLATAAEALVSSITESARRAEQKYASQAKVNGIESSWDEFRAGFETTYDEPAINLTPINGNDPRRFTNPLVQKYPYLEVAQFIDQYPDATEQEIQELVGATGGDKGGISSILAPVTKKYPEGYKGGQCGVFAHKIVDFPPVGDSKKSKIAAVNKYGISSSKWRSDVRVGDVIITGENPTYGHVAIVNEILPDGRIKLTESNYKQSEKVSHDRTISINSSQIYGAIRGRLKISNLA
jgi:hypothetical protein